MEDRQWEDALKLNHRPRRMGGSGYECFAKGCPNAKRHRWYYSYDNEGPEASTERAKKDGWTAIQGDDPERWVQVHGWFCSPKCLKSPEADQARQRAAEWVRNKPRTKRESPVAIRQDRIAQVLATLITAVVSGEIALRAIYRGSPWWFGVGLVVSCSLIVAGLTRPPRSTV